MFKKVLSTTAIALALALSLTSASVFADGEDDIMPINDTSETTPLPDTDGEITEPSDDITDNAAIDLEEGTTPAADEAEENDNEDEEEGEPETWPMYVSLGALGAAVLIFIILNIFGRKKRQ